MMKIDAHHHLWLYNTEEYGWISDDMHMLRRDFLVSDLQAELQAAHVDGTIAVQARQTIKETRWLLELATSKSPILGVVGWLPLVDLHLGDLLEEFCKMPKLKGLRHIVQGENPGFLDGSAFNHGVSKLHKVGLVYDLLIYAHQLEETIRFVDRHPAQAFVLDHIAKPDIRHCAMESWGAGLRRLALRPNVSCKISGMVTETDWTRWTPNELAPYFETTLQAFGPERLMIGTDWPVVTVGCKYADWWHTVENWISELSSNERAQILGETATRVYQLHDTVDDRSHHGGIAA
jgi:L-fuconolactonase